MKALAENPSCIVIGTPDRCVMVSRAVPRTVSRVKTLDNIVKFDDFVAPSHTYERLFPLAQRVLDVKKFNPHHDPDDGRFTFATGGGVAGVPRYLRARADAATTLTADERRTLEHLQRTGKVRFDSHLYDAVPRLIELDLIDPLGENVTVAEFEVRAAGRAVLRQKPHVEKVPHIKSTAHAVPMSEVATSWYHGHPGQEYTNVPDEAFAEGLKPRGALGLDSGNLRNEDIRAMDGLGVWLTDDKAHASMFGKRVLEVQDGEHLDMRNIKLFSVPGTFFEGFITSERTKRLLGRDLTAREKKLSPDDIIRPSGAFAPRGNGESKKFWAGVQQELLDAGYDGLLWKNNKADRTDAEHGVNIAVLFKGTRARLLKLLDAIAKFNPNHDPDDGRFTSGPGGYTSPRLFRETFAETTLPKKPSLGDFIEGGWGNPLFTDTPPEHAARVDALLRQSRDAEIQWGVDVQRKLASGAVTYAEARKAGFVGNDDDPWEPLPATMWHATTDLASVTQQGLKAAAELQPGTAGLGGGDASLISFTDKEQIAHDIVEATLEFRALLRGDRTIDDMIADAKAGGYWDFLNREFATHENIRDGALARYRQGLTIGHTKYRFDTTHPVRDLEAQGFKVLDVFGGPDNKTYASAWERPWTEDERLEKLRSINDVFSVSREHVTGKLWPLWWAPNLKAIRDLDPQNVGVVSVTPRANARGKHMNALGEWRTMSGEHLGPLNVVSFGKRARTVQKFNPHHDRIGRFTFGPNNGMGGTVPRYFPTTTDEHDPRRGPRFAPDDDGAGQRLIAELWNEESWPNPVGDDRERLVGKRVGEEDTWGGLIVRPGWEPNEVHIELLRAITRGGGRVAMTKLVEMADAHGVTLDLEAVPLDTMAGKKMTPAKLKAWYKSFGFEGRIAGKDGHMTVSAPKSPYMVREPRVAKFNPHHDEKGRFTYARGAPTDTQLSSTRVPQFRYFMARATPEKQPKTPTEQFLSAMWKNSKANPLQDDERLIGSDAEGWGAMTLIDPLRAIGGGTSHDEAEVHWVRAVTRGGGRVAMLRITEAADKAGVRLTLHAIPTKTTGEGKKLSQKKLNAFYTSFGFREIPYDYEYDPTGRSNPRLTSGKGPNWFARAPRVKKFNPNHDRLGRFATADEAAYVSPARYAATARPPAPTQTFGEEDASFAARLARWTRMQERIERDAALLPKTTGIPDNTDLVRAIKDEESLWSIRLKTHAEKAGVLPGTMRYAIRDAAKEMLADTNIWSRIDDDVLDELLTDDPDRNHLWNQYRVGDSKGYYSPVVRAIAEDLLFGYRMPEGTYTPESFVDGEHVDLLQTRNRPVYGYVSNDPNGGSLPITTLENAAKYDPAANYGDIALKFKSRLRERTTVMWGDSLNAVNEDYREGQTQRYQRVGENERDLRVNARTPNFEDAILHIPVPLAHPTEHFVSAGYWGIGVPSKKVLEGTQALMGHYIEAQIHGDHLTLNDVEEVVFNHTPRDYQRAGLQARGIRVRVRGEHF